MTFTFYLPTFSNTLSNRFSISFSILFKYYFFIHYLFFFLTTTHLPTFYYNRKKNFWRMNSSPSDLMSYCSWAKKIPGYREPIGECFYGLILYYREFYVFTYTVGDALKCPYKILPCQIMQLFFETLFSSVAVELIPYYNSLSLHSTFYFFTRLEITKQRICEHSSRYEVNNSIKLLTLYGFFVL